MASGRAAGLSSASTVLDQYLTRFVPYRGGFEMMDHRVEDLSCLLLLQRTSRYHMLLSVKIRNLTPQPMEWQRRYGLDIGLG